MRTLDLSDTATPKTAVLREALAALNPLEMWRAWQEAADQVCLMAPAPLRQRDHQPN
jgi:hypothetical protein